MGDISVWVSNAVPEGTRLGFTVPQQNVRLTEQQSSIEPSIGILSACLPNLRPLLVKVRDRVTSNHSSNTYGEANSQGSQGAWNRGPKSNNLSSKKSGPAYKEEDEVYLTNMTTAGGSSDSVQQRAGANSDADRAA
jgi:hypothetical protein